MLGAADSEEVDLELSTPTKAGLLKPRDKNDSEELLMLVMPLMLNQ
jgi:DNA polymerase-3 subunit beta